MLRASGLQEVQELEDKFAKSSGLKMANGLWSRYMRGEVVPQGALQPGGRNNLVHRVAKMFPKTADVFYAPFWEYLEWDPMVNLDQVKAAYLRLGEDISRLFVARTEVDGKRLPVAMTKFWYLRKSIDARRKVVSALPNWDSLVVYLLEARMSYVAQSFDVFVDCQLMACQALLRLQQDKEFEAKRLQGVLLTMEALCLDAMVINVGRPYANDGPRIPAFERFTDWLRDWNRRCNAHAQSLSSKSRLAFVQILEADTLVGRPYDRR